MEFNLSVDSFDPNKYRINLRYCNVAIVPHDGGRQPGWIQIKNQTFDG